MRKIVLVVFIIAFLLRCGELLSQQSAHIAVPYDEENLILKSSKGEITFSPFDLTTVDDALKAGADYLLHAQADITEDNAGNGNPDNPDDPDDGGWDWKLTDPNFTHSASNSPKNIYGATAQGLYYAYLATNNAAYFTAMKDAADIMISDPDIRSSNDLVFLMKFQDLAGVTADIYQNAAKEKFDGRITTYSTATGLAEYIRDVRAGQGYENGIIPWDVGTFAVVARMLADRYPGATYDYAQASADIAEVLYQDSYMLNPGYFDLTTNKNNGWDPTYANKDYWWYTLGITGLIDAFSAADVHTTELSGLITILQDCQYDHGGFSYCYGANTDDEDWQSTAYAVLSLAAYDLSSYQDEINNATYWLTWTQDQTSGAWIYSSSGNHYPEIGGENTAALYFGQNPDEVWVDDDYDASTPGWDITHFATVENGIEAVMAGGTVNVSEGTYSEEILFTKQVNLLGNNTGISVGANPGTRNAETIIDGGFYVQTGSGGSVIDGFTIQNGFTSGSHKTGIVVGSTGITIRNNIIKDCLGSQSQGIETISGVANTLLIKDNEIVNNYRGIYLNPADGISIEGNSIHANNGVGVGIGSDGQSNLTLTGNLIYDHTLEGWGMSAVGTNVNAHNNSFTNNGVSVAHYSGSQVDATCNWWGSADADDVAAAVSGDVQFLPFLTSQGGNCNGQGPFYNNDQGTSYMTLQDAISAAAPGETIVIEGGLPVFTSTININKSIILKGAPTDALTLIQTSGSSTLFSVTADNVTIQDLEIQKTDKVSQNIIYVGGNNFEIFNCDIYGQFVIGDGQVDRGLEIAAVTGLNIHDIDIHNLRQPAYINAATGSITDNYTYVTKGWVIVTQSNLTFTGNTWGTGTDVNYYDIAIIKDSPEGANNYPDIVSMSENNNDAIIENQHSTYSPAILSIVHVNGSVSTGNGSILEPYKTIAEAFPRVATGGKVKVASGTYVQTSQLAITKNLRLIGSGSAHTIIEPGFNTTTGGYQVSSALVYIDYGVTATIEDLSIDGTGYTVRHAIQARGADLTVRNCEIRDIYAGTYLGRGILYLTGTGLVENCSMSNIQRIGVHIRGAEEPVAPVVDVTGFTYTGKGAGDWLDYAVEFGGGGKGTVDNLTATDCLGVASTDGSTSAGILVTDYYGTITEAEISNSVFNNNTTGIAVGYAATDASVCTAYGNSFLGTGYGITQIGINTVDAENNYWGTIVGSEVQAKTTGMVDYSPWCNSDFSICYEEPGPVTTIPNITEQCYDATFTVPVTVTDFAGVGSIALVMNYDESVLSLSSVTWNSVFDDPNLNDPLYFLPSAGKISFSWFDDNAIDIPDNEALFTLEFTYTGSSCPDPFITTDLTWDDSDPVYCEYATPEGNIFVDDPFASYFIAGSIEIKDITTPTITFCPNDITVEVDESTNPSVHGFATATDNCGTVEVTFADSWAAGGCIGTGTITRTWTATDACGNEATCVQTIVVEDNSTPAITCPANISVNNDLGVCGAEVDFDLQVSLDPGYNEGWEDANYVMGEYGGWRVYNSTISSVASGTNGISSKSGSRHGLIEDPVSGNTGTYSWLGAPNTSFCNGYRVRLDVYMDLNDPLVTSGNNADYGWDLSVAAWGQDGSHQRDFIFHTASNPAGEILVGASNNSNNNPRGDLASINHHTITSSGWYTFEWIFYDDGGILSVDLNLLDDGGNWLWTESRSNPLDIIATEVGGNGYMWFTFLETTTLSIDNAKIERYTDVTSDYSSGYEFPVGTTTVTVTSTDCCTNEVTCTFDVEVIDDQLPEITCPTPDPFYVVNDVCVWEAYGLEPVISDNCGTPDLYYSVDGGTNFVSGNVNGYAFPIGTSNVIYKVIDPSSNEVTCNFDVVVQGVTLTGNVDYYNAALTDMNNVTVKLQQGGTDMYTTTTDVGGVYTISDVCLGAYDVVLSTVKDVGSINSTDAAQVNYWSVFPSSIEMVRHFAGDVNGDNSILSNDAGLIQQYFLTMGNPNPAFATDWSFWKAGEIISANSGPGGYPALTVTDASPIMNQDFYGLVTGDFNRSFTPGSAKSGNGSITLTYGEDIEISSSEFELPLYAGIDMNVGAVSLILNLPTDLLTVQGVFLGSNPDASIMYAVQEDQLLISWQSLDPVSVQKGDPLLTLKLELTSQADENGIRLTLADNALNELADDNYLVIEEAALVVDVIHTTFLGIYESGTAERIMLTANPNPLKQSTNLEYSLPADGQVRLEICDMLGNKIETLVSENQQAGNHQIIFDATTLKPGIYIATLKLQNSNTILTQTIKLVIK